MITETITAAALAALVADISDPCARAGLIAGYVESEWDYDGLRELGIDRENRDEHEAFRSEYRRLAQVVSDHAKIVAKKGRGYAPALNECLEAAARGELWAVDTQNCGEDCWVVAATAPDAIAEVAAYAERDPSGWDAAPVA